MKVLLMLCNKALFSAVVKALLIWFSANLVGCAILCSVGFFFLQSPADFIGGLILSLIFSSPAVGVATWVLYALPSFNNVFKRSTLSLLSILITSAVIILLVAIVFRMEYIQVARVLYPFTLSAIACFFFIARKQIATSSKYYSKI